VHQLLIKNFDNSSMHGTNLKITDYVIQLFCMTDQVDFGNKKIGKFLIQGW